MITYWIIITTVVIELLYINKFCYNKDPGLLLWEYNNNIDPKDRLVDFYC